MCAVRLVIFSDGFGSLSASRHFCVVFLLGQVEDFGFSAQETVLHGDILKRQSLCGRQTVHCNEKRRTVRGAIVRTWVTWRRASEQRCVQLVQSFD